MSAIVVHPQDSRADARSLTHALRPLRVAMSSWSERASTPQAGPVKRYPCEFRPEFRSKEAEGMSVSSTAKVSLPLLSTLSDPT
jgi:hypothetical protein